MNVRWLMPVAFAAGIIAAAQPAFAQRFVNYRCSDGDEFVMAFFDDSRKATVQLDGHSLTLSRALSVSGTRYARGGISIVLKGDQVTLKRRGAPAAACVAG